VWPNLANFWPGANFRHVPGQLRTQLNKRMTKWLTDGSVFPQRECFVVAGCIISCLSNGARKAKKDTFRLADSHGQTDQRTIYFQRGSRAQEQVHWLPPESLTPERQIHIPSKAFVNVTTLLLDFGGGLLGPLCLPSPCCCCFLPLPLPFSASFTSGPWLQRDSFWAAVGGTPWRRPYPALPGVF